jgi:hypothetical protein
VTWLAQAQAALGDIAGARVALEQVVSTGMDFGFVLANATVALADVLRVAGEPRPTFAPARPWPSPSGSPIRS